jgi:ubiquinone/menaquinone biosynthesis C-methylase UbiE
VTIHPSAEAFAGVAATYERGRPEYPRGLLDWLTERGDIRAGASVVDIGAGTGKLTRLLVGHGARVIAVDPLPEMLAELENVVPQAERRLGRATALPIDDESADLAVCGQSFHWFASAEALAEIARVLRPDGSLVLVWNVRDESDPVQARLSELFERDRGDTPSHRSGVWREVMNATTRFRPDGEYTATTEQLVDRAGLIDRVESTSSVAALTGGARGELLAEVGSLVPSTGRIALRYRTDAYGYRRANGRMAP